MGPQSVSRGLLGLVAIAGGLSCSGGPPADDAPRTTDEPVAGAPIALDQETSVSDTSVIAAQEALTPTVMALPGVVGTAVGLCEGAPCIQILVATADSALLEELPESFRGFTVDVQVVGEIRALDTTDTGSEPDGHRP